MRGGERYRGGEREFGILGRPHVSQPSYFSLPAQVHNSQLFKVYSVPGTTVHWVMDGFPSQSSCIFMLSQWAIRRNTEVIYVLHNVYMMSFALRVRVLRIHCIM